MYRGLSYACVMVGEYDKQEGDADVQAAMRLLSLAKKRFVALPKSLEPPKTGSMLFQEEELTSPMPADHIVMGHRARAYENIERIFETIFNSEQGVPVAYPFSLYSMIRPAVEAAAVAMWVIKSHKKADRVFRSLRVAYGEAGETLRFAELWMGKKATAKVRQSTEAARERLRKQQQRVGAIRQLELTGIPKYTDILTAVSPKKPARLGEGYEATSPLIVWKIASGVLHGNSNLIRAISDIRQINDFVNGTAAFEITPSWRMIAGSLHACVLQLEELDKRYNFLATHDYSGRPVVPAP